MGFYERIFSWGWGEGWGGENWEVGRLDRMRSSAEPILLFGHAISDYRERTILYKPPI